LNYIEIYIKILIIFILIDNQSMDLADEIYSIKDTNIMLKKQLNDERERSKM